MVDGKRVAFEENPINVTTDRLAGDGVWTILLLVGAMIMTFSTFLFEMIGTVLYICIGWVCQWVHRMQFEQPTNNPQSL